MKKVLLICIPAGIAVIYMLGPAIAAMLKYSDRRGPTIYLQGYHEAVFLVVYESLYGEKPRIPIGVGRPIFYGMNVPAQAPPPAIQRALDFRKQQSEGQ